MERLTLNAAFGSRQVRTVDDVGSIARRFRVSLRATAVRLIRLNRADHGLYERVDREADFKGPGGGGGGETRAEGLLDELLDELPRLVISRRCRSAPDAAFPPPAREAPTRRERRAPRPFATQPPQAQTGGPPATRASHRRRPRSLRDR